MGLFSRFQQNDTKKDDEYEDFQDNGGGYYDIDDMDGKGTYPKPADTAAIADPEKEAAPAAPKAAAKPAVSLKLVKPYSPKEATDYVDMLKENCIVVIDISALNRESALRLIDYLSGAVYALDGDLKKTNQNTLVLAPKGVDISSMIPATAPKTENAEEPEATEQA